MAVIEEVFETQRQILAKLAGLEQRLGAVEERWRRRDEADARFVRKLQEQEAQSRVLEGRVARLEAERRR